GSGAIPASAGSTPTMTPPPCSRPWPPSWRGRDGIRAARPRASGTLVGDMRLTKHHGLGNDFLVVLDPEAAHPLDAEIARQLCDRHTGIGADGVMRAVPPAPGEPAIARMELRNADGSRAEMSGNGIRCFAQALRLGGWPGAEADEIAVATDAGLRTVTVHGRVDEVRLDDAWPDRDAHDVRVTCLPGERGCELVRDGTLVVAPE